MTEKKLNGLVTCSSIGLVACSLGAVSLLLLPESPTLIQTLNQATIQLELMISNFTTVERIITAVVAGVVIGIYSSRVKKASSSISPKEYLNSTKEAKRNKDTRVGFPLNRMAQDYINRHDPDVVDGEANEVE